MRVQTLMVGVFQSNCFIASCKDTNEAIIVDAGDDEGRILAAVREGKLRVRMIVNTHAHLDHVGALPVVARTLGVPVLMHRSEMAIYSNLGQQAAMFGMPAPELVEIDRFIKEGDEVVFGRLKGRIIETPGHSPGGISLVFEDEVPPRIFVGDVLFRGSIGRTDLFGANHVEMISTLRNIIMKLPDDMIVYSGHGPETTIGLEKESNPFLIELGSAG